MTWGRLNKTIYVAYRPHQNKFNWARVFASSRRCAAVVVFPVRSFACTGNRARRSPEPSSLRSYIGRGRISFLKKFSVWLLPIFTMAHGTSPPPSSARDIFNGNVPPPLVDDLDLVPSSPASSPYVSPLPATTYPIGRYISRDVMLSFVLSNLCGVRAMLAPVILFMLCNMLLDNASIHALLNLIFKVVMIYISGFNLKKIPNYFTIQSRHAVWESS